MTTATATLISQIDGRSYVLVCDKKTVQIYNGQIDEHSYVLVCDKKTVQIYSSNDCLLVYCENGRPLDGRIFYQETAAARLDAAINSYKDVAVKCALEALADHLA